MGMLYYFDNEPIAIDPCNRGRAEGKDSVVGCFEQQAVKLRLVAGKHKNPRSADCHLAPASALPDTVVIAWKPTPEAARAVTAAMPFLSMAREIVIMTVAENETTIQEEGADRLMANLRWDGFAASVRRLKPGPPGAAETSLAAAREQAALLVMGGYGHSRLREWIFGGFTQRVLRSAEVPVLIAH